MTALDRGLDAYERGVTDGRRLALAELDLDDPETENAVANAIIRLHAPRSLPLSARYPWRFPEPGRCGAPYPVPDVEASCVLRAGHAGMHEDVVWPVADPEHPGYILKPGHAYWSDADPEGFRE